MAWEVARTHDRLANRFGERTSCWTRSYDWDGRDMLTGVRPGRSREPRPRKRYLSDTSRPSLSKITLTLERQWAGSRTNSR